MVRALVDTGHFVKSWRRRFFELKGLRLSYAKEFVACGRCGFVLVLTVCMACGFPFSQPYIRSQGSHSLGQVSHPRQLTTHAPTACV